MNINDKLNQIFDHDGTLESSVLDPDTDDVISPKDNGVTKNMKDCLNFLYSRKAPSMNDQLFFLMGIHNGDTDDGLVLTMNDRIKSFFGGGNINDAIYNHNATITGTEIESDTDAPVISDLTLEDAYSSGMVWSFETNKAGVFHAVLLDNGGTAPTPTQIRERKDGDGVVQASSRVFSAPMDNKSSNAVSFQNLNSLTEYDLYITCEDSNFPSVNYSNIVYSDTASQTEDGDWSGNPDLIPFSVEGGEGSYHLWFYRHPTRTEFFVNGKMSNEGGQTYTLGATMYLIAVDYDITHIPTPSEVKLGVTYGSGSNEVIVRASASTTPWSGGWWIRQNGFRAKLEGLDPDTRYDIYATSEKGDKLSEEVHRLSDVRTAETNPFNNYSTALGNWFGVIPDITSSSGGLSSDAWTFSGWFKNLNPIRYNMIPTINPILSYGVDTGYWGTSEDYGFNSTTDTQAEDTWFQLKFDTLQGQNTGFPDYEPYETSWYVVTEFHKGDDPVSIDTKVTEVLKIATDYEFPFYQWCNIQVKHNTTGRVDVWLKFKDPDNGTIINEHIHTHQAPSSDWYVSPVDENKQVSYGANRGMGLYNENSLMNGNSIFFAEKTLVNEFCVWHTLLSSTELDYVFNEGVPFDLTENGGDSTGNYSSANDIHKYTTFNNVSNDYEWRNGEAHIYINSDEDRGIGNFLGGAPWTDADHSGYLDGKGVLVGDTPNNPVENIHSNYVRYSNDRVYPASSRQSTTKHTGGTE